MPVRNCKYEYAIQFIFGALIFIAILYKITEIVVRVFNLVYKW